MKLPKLEVLSKEEIKTIDAASIELLSTAGIKIDTESHRKLCEKNGAEVNNDTKFVKFSEELIREKLRFIILNVKALEKIRKSLKIIC